MSRTTFNIKGNDVARVLVSRTFESRGDLEQTKSKLEQERSACIARKRQINGKFMDLNMRVVGKTLPQDQYAAICAEQKSLKLEQMEIDAKLAELRKRIHEFSHFPKAGDTEDLLWKVWRQQENIIRELVAVRSLLESKDGGK